MAAVIRWVEKRRACRKQRRLKCALKAKQETGCCLRVVLP